jgi:NAD(P)-dependent dehydrogenase (short-subunit alcohol dehydrogenase family)
MNFEGKRYVLTGVASGIGAATARALGEAGAYVIGVDRNTPEANVDEFHACNLAEPAQIDALASVLKQPLDGLVNIAGVPGSKPVDLIAKVNVLAVRRLTEALLPRIADEGAVVNVASAAGLYWRNRLDAIKEILAARGWDEGLDALLSLGFDPSALYDFSKEVVIVYSALVSSAERHRGVRVNSVSPGAVETPILREFYATMDNALLNKIKAQAGGRDARPDEIVGPILFLLSKDARWVNGTDLLVDGGGEVAMTLGDLAAPPRAL